LPLHFVPACDLDAVVKANPTKLRALFQQARIFVKRGQLEQAENNFKQVLAAFPRDRISLRQLGVLTRTESRISRRSCPFAGAKTSRKYSSSSGVSNYIHGRATELAKLWLYKASINGTKALTERGELS
jgi:hypothetical protein